MKMDDNEVIVGRFKPVQNLNKIDWKPVRLTPGTWTWSEEARRVSLNKTAQPRLIHCQVTPTQHLQIYLNWAFNIWHNDETPQSVKHFEHCFTILLFSGGLIAPLTASAWKCATPCKIRHFVAMQLGMLLVCHPWSVGLVLKLQHLGLRAPLNI